MYQLVNNSKIKMEPGITGEREWGDTVSSSESNDDGGREVDFIDGIMILSYTSLENLVSDAHYAQQSESTSSSKKEEITPRFTVDISDGKFQVNWRSLAADTENNNVDNIRIIKGRRSERYKESISS